jgi:TetR/AcrR family transcriptional regulator
VNALSPLVEKVFRPLTDRTQRVLEEGIRSGELIRADPSQMRYAALGANILYFLSAPLMHLVQGSDPLESSALKSRRSSAIQYLGLALFTDRKHGMKVARRVLAATPMPAHGGLPPRSATEFPSKKKHAVRHT